MLGVRRALVTSCLRMHDSAPPSLSPPHPPHPPSTRVPHPRLAPGLPPHHALHNLTVCPVRADAAGGAAAGSLVGALPVPVSKDCFTAEWLTRAMHEFGSLADGATVTELSVTFLKGEEDPAAGGVATAINGGMVLKLEPSYSGGAAAAADAPRSIVAKLMPKMAISAFDPEDRIDQAEVWAYTSGMSKMCMGPECYFAKYWASPLVAGCVSVAVLLLEDLSSDYEDNGGGIHAFLDVRFDKCPRAMYPVVARGLADLHTKTR